MFKYFSLSVFFLSVIVYAGSFRVPSNPSMSQKLGQMLLLGFRGTEATEQSHVVQDILSQKIGGVILFDTDKPSRTSPRNIVSYQQVNRLICGLQSFSKIPLLVAVDQEGGQVSRLKPEAGFPFLPSAKIMSRLSSDSLTVLAYNCALNLRDLGININLAPVVDLNIDPSSKAIAALGRSFGSDTATVIRCASIFLDAHYHSGVFSTLKHFPGHGSGRGDTHEGIVDVTNTWRKTELVPFRSLINSGMVSAVMTNHVYNSKLDPVYPATLSSSIINGILRQDLSWNGLVITDDLQMDAIRKKYSLEETLELSIKAGADILLIGNNSFAPYDSSLAQKAMNILMNLVSTGKITHARVDSSWARIMTLKKKLPRLNTETIPVRLLCVNPDSTSIFYDCFNDNGFDIRNLYTGENQPYNKVLIDSLLKNWWPDAIILPYPVHLSQKLPSLVSKLRSSIQNLNPNNPKPVMYGFIHTTDTANQKIIMDRYYKKNQISTILKLIEVSLWNEKAVSLNIRDLKSDTLYRLVPFAAQNSGRISDVSSVIKANLRKSENKKSAKKKLSSGNMSLKR
jgi:beta-N-acetylhexosaminidase